MKRAQFSVPVADLEYGDRELDEDIPVEWLRTALEGTEAVPEGRPGRLTLTLSKSGRDVMVRGQVSADVTMPCARTLDPVPVKLRSDIFLLLAPAPSTPHPPKQAQKRHAKAGGPNDKRGPKPARREEEGLLSDADAARDTYDGEDVVLDPFVREFLLLELPMVPVREDLRSEATPAIERPPREPDEEEGPKRDGIDPRLAPLAAIASRLREKKE
jgi:uncharacterized protein